MKSKRFAIDFIRRHGIGPEILAIERWNKRTGHLTYDESLFDPAARKWVRKPRANRPVTPTDWELSKEFLEHSVESLKSLLNRRIDEAERARIVSEALHVCRERFAWESVLADYASIVDQLAR